MTFFNSEIVQDEMMEIEQMQQTLYGHLFNFASLSNEDKKEHVHIMRELVNKQRILYTRLCLSDDEEAQEMKEAITTSAIHLGMPRDMTMATVFENMEKLIDIMESHVQ